MKALVFFVSGVITGLSFAHLPRWAPFTDQPPTPVDWKPRYRFWQNGTEISNLNPKETP